MELIIVKHSSIAEDEIDATFNVRIYMVLAAEVRKQPALIAERSEYLIDILYRDRLSRMPGSILEHNVTLQEKWHAHKDGRSILNNRPSQCHEQASIALWIATVSFVAPSPLAPY